MQFCQVGEFESSKSAMNIFAPELSALITIFRSTGPVISTRRSCSSAGTGATRQSPSRIVLRLRQEVGELAVAQALRPLVPRCEQLAPPRAERPLELGEEVDRVGGEDGLRRMRGLYGVSARIRSAATFWSRVSLPSGERTISSATLRRGAEAEVGAGILGGEVAAPGVELAHEPAGRPAARR